MAAIQAGYLGCFAGGSYLAELMSTDLTVQLCQKECYAAGFGYAVLFDSITCRCAAVNDGESTKASYCNIACAGDPGQICGGLYAQSVWLAACYRPTSESSDCRCNAGYSSDSVPCTIEAPTGASNSPITPTPAPGVPDQNFFPPAQSSSPPARATMTLAPSIAPNQARRPAGPTTPPNASPTGGTASNATIFADSAAPGGGSSQNSGAVIGGAVGGTLAGMMVCALGLGLYLARRRKRREPAPATQTLPAELSHSAPWATATWAPAKLAVADEAGLGTAQQLHSGHGAAAVAQSDGPPPYASSYDTWRQDNCSYFPSNQGTAPVPVVAGGIGAAAVGGVVGAQAVAGYKPWASAVIGLLEELADRLGSVHDNGDTSSRAVPWAHHMIGELASLGQNFQDRDPPPAARPLMALARSSVHDLLEVARGHRGANPVSFQQAYNTAVSNLRRALNVLNHRPVDPQPQVDERHNLVIESLTRQQTWRGGMNVSLAQFSDQLTSDGLGDVGGGGHAVEAMAEALERLQIPPKDVTVMTAPIGQGSFAKVFPCDYQGEIRAAKVVDLAACTSRRQLDKVYERFTRELYIMSTLQDTNLIKVFGAITEARQLTIIMELGERGSLRGVLDDPAVSGTLTRAAQHVVLSDVAAGMAYLYREGVQHRDLKSLNVLIMHDWHAKVSDYGLHRTRQSLSTIAARSDSHGGAWAWKAPELLDGSADFSEKSDVYSFGVIVWEVVCGGVKRPWHGLDTVQLLAAVRQGNRLLIDAKCSQAHRTIMEAAWKAPADRPSFSAIWADLEASP